MSTTESIGDQRTRLADLALREKSVESLRERQQRLEVDSIAAQVAFKSCKLGARSDLDENVAGRIGQALAERQALEARLGRARDDASRTSHRSQKFDRYRAAIGALGAWLDAPSANVPTFSAGVKWALVLLTLIILIAGFAVHYALLILLVPLVGATSFLMWTGQDTAWRRMGAKRQFDESGLAAPAEWEAQAVRTRLAELEASYKQLREADCETGPRTDFDEDDDQTVTAKLQALNEEIAKHLSEAGLDEESLDPDTVHWLVLAGRALSTKAELDAANDRLKVLSSEVEAIREKLFWFLARHGEAPENGRADAETLAAALNRVARPTKGPPSH